MRSLRWAIVSLLVALSALVLPLAFSGSAGAQTAGYPLDMFAVQPGAPQMEGVLWFKYQMWLRGTPVGLGRNVAAMWGDYDGQPFEVVLPSAGNFWSGQHAEERVLQALRADGIPDDAITGGYSDLGPCQLISTNCTALIRALPNMKEFTYGDPYPPYSRSLSPAENAQNWAIRRLSVMRLKEMNAGLRSSFEEAQGMWNPGCVAGGGGDPNGLEGGDLRAGRVPSRTAVAAPGTDCGPNVGEGPEDGALPEELGDPAEALDPGGIDFSSLQLRYLSLSGPHQNTLHYSMDSDGAPVTTNSQTGLQTAQEDSDAFFTWLTLPTNTFWVNLSPSSPPQVIDPRMALTDAGRVMLQSDLLLKEAGQAAMNPATPSGAQYWPPFLALPPGSVTSTGPCWAFRVWIVPGVATVHATKTQLYILSAPLTVKMAMVNSLPGKLVDPKCPQDAWTTTWETQYRNVIVPQLIQEVNTAPQFEPLRRVYMSRVAAQWVRENASPGSVMGRLVDSGLHRSWIAQPSWSANTIWEQYLQQFNAPQTPYTIPVQENGTTVNATVYVAGGVNFRSKVREMNTSNRQFKTRWHGLAAAATRSIKRPSKGGGTTLVGGGIKLGTSTHRSKHLKVPEFVRIPRRFIPPTPSAP